MSDKTDGLQLNSQVQGHWLEQPPQNEQAQVETSQEMVSRRNGKQARGVLSALRISSLAFIFALSLLISVTDAQAVKVLSGLISLQQQTLVGQIHPVTLTLYRDTNSQPIIEWQNDQCFKLQFDTPYSQSDLWFPFDPESPPECSLPIKLQPLIGSVNCRVGDNRNQLHINFMDITAPDLKQISLDFNNFQNPWSAITVESIRITSYNSQDCSGSAESSQGLGSQTFYSLDIPEENVKITSSSNILGDSDPANTVTFAFMPSYTTSKDGRGVIAISIPPWYNVQGKLNMMYSEQARNKCTSPNMEITSSIPNLIFGSLMLTYKNMKPEFISGAEIIIECQGFKNPIFEKKWSGFRISLFDSELIPNTISMSASIEFDAFGMTPSVIPINGLTIIPSIFKIAEYSVWVFSLTVFPIPLEQKCYVKIYIPADLAYKNTVIKGTQMMAPNSGDIITPTKILTEADGGTTIEFEACFRENSVGPSPTGRIEINSIQTPVARRDTGEFGFEVFKDYAFTSSIAKLGEPIVIYAGNLAPGINKVFSIIPENIGVQIVTNYMIMFETEHTLYPPAAVKIEFPPSIILPPANTVVVIKPQVPVKEFFLANTGTVRPGNIIQIDNVYGGIQPPTGPMLIELLIEGIQNPYSSQPAGDVTILTYYETDMVDTGTSDGSFTPTSGIITGVPINVVDPITNGSNSIYTLVFTPQSSIPKNGFIHIMMPERLVMRESEVQSAGACTSPTLTCTEVDQSKRRIIIKTQEIIAAGTPTSIVIMGITNPRSVQSTQVVHMTTFDADGISEIDSGFDIGTTMVDLAKITGFSVRPSSTINGVMNTYTFTLSTVVNFEQGDVLRYTMPPKVILPATVEELNITPLPRTVDGNDVTDVLEVEIQGQTIIITFVEVAPTTQTYKWTLDNMKNPPSTKESTPIVDIITTNKEGWNIQEYSATAIGASPPTIENKQPAIITQHSLLQRNDEPATKTTYEIKFVPINPIPSSGSIQISWPEIVKVPNETKCTVITNKNWTSNCIIDQGKQTITISDVFSEVTAFVSEVTILLEGVINPTDNKQKGSGFILMTYDSGTQTNRIDKIPSTELVPSLDCDYPCKTCTKSDRKNCQSCWTQDFSDKRYFVETLDQGTCEASCPYGQTRDNSDSYVCIDCDVSCESCKDESKTDCMVCAQKFPFKVSGTSHCLETCSRGYYETTTSFTCATCEAPCADCKGDSKVCTACDTRSEFPVLFQENCIKECAPGYTAVNGVCEKCSSPCGTCEGAINKCLSCDGTEERRFLYASQCYSECPTNSSPFSEDEKNLICIGCTDPACELCDAKEPGICKRCSDGLYVNDGVCVSGCPDGWKTNLDSTACVLFTINDIGIIPFPFLIMAFLGCMIAMFGKCKKKLVGRNNKYISTQNTITCFIVILAGVQFLAIIALIIWALLFGTMFLFYAACGLLGVLIILNIVFQIFYTCTFNRMFTPKDKLRKYKEGKISKAELKRYIKPIDELFHQYALKHKCFSWTIAIFTFMCTFKCNKAYYSHFYSFSMFKARWSQGENGKYYRKSMTIFCIVAMILDAMIICLCIASLMTMTVMANMLWVTTVEVAALSLLLVIFGCIELYMMKPYLKYNEVQKSGYQRQKFDVSSANDFLDKDSREVMMKNLLRNVKTNQDMFLNNKLDDLLNLFGDRRCKSMIEFGTGWDKEDDPRRVITWPLSPNTIKEYDGEYKFTREDMIGGFEDNVYAEAKVKPTIYEVAVQGDQGEQDFMRQMHRKQGDMLSGQMDEVDELATRKTKGKRRGRKNKYYTAIDAEDDEEADGQEPSVEEDDDQQDNLAIIREQEEEEEALRLKVEEERQKQEQAQAERRAKLAEAERLRLEAEQAEEDSRRQAADEEERLREIQEGEELSRMRELEVTRARLGREEEEARLKVEADEVNRQKELAAMNEANRAKYEAEDAVRRKALEEEQARLKKEKEEHEAKIAAQLAEMNKRKLEETERMQVQRDEEELRLRKQQLEREEQIRQEEKEAERLRLEQEAAERRKLAANSAEEKRAARLEEERLQRESDELERQRKLAKEDHARQEAYRLEEEARQKRNSAEDARKRQMEEEQRLHKERLDMDDEARRLSIQKEEAERRERQRREEESSKLRLEEAEIQHKSKLQGEEHERLTALQQKESDRLLQLQEEETLRLQRLKLEEEHRLGSLQQEESSRRLILVQEEEARLRRIELEDDARKRQEEADQKRKTAEEAIRAREEEDRILKEREKIEAQKAALAAAKAKQEAELAAIQKKDEERKLREARETEERIERERLEREAMEKEKAELARKQKIAEQKLLAEKDDLTRAKLLKEAEELENQEKLRKEREAFELEKRRKEAADEAARQQADREKLEAEAKRIESGTQMSKMQLDSEKAISEKKLEEEDEALEAEIVMSQELIQDFQKPKHPIEMPPNADNRTFNVNDILGELDRDDRGNIVVLQDSQGNNCDKTGHMTNIRGYLQDPVSLDILENHTQEKMFSDADLDDKGELPAPFCVEKFNFNPHDLMGDLEFQYDSNTGRAIPQLLQTKQGFYVDKKARRVNRFGWLVQGGNGHIVDKLGRKKFDRKQLDDGDLQKLLNYNGKRYDIKDVIGVFDKDANGSIILQRGNANSFTDNVGRRVNEKGYLIDFDGHIIDREGKHIFAVQHLKNGEFPKIFLFTKFNIDNIMGDFEMSPLSEPILDQDKNGNFIDRKGRMVNSRGYLINAHGDVIDKRGKLMFDKVVLTPEGEIPKIFRMQILKTDSGSSLSRLMDEIEKNQPSEYERVEEEQEKEDEGGDGDTSVDSAMEDTPANYNMANQRFDEYEDYEAIPEETEHKNSRMANRRRAPPQAQVEAAMEMPKKKTKKKTKKKKKTGYLEYLMPTGREVNMADAYGGQAKGQFRRNGVKYDKERLMNRIKTPANIPGGRAQLEALAATVAGFHKPNQSKMVGDEDNMDQRSARGPASRPPRVKRNQFMDGDSQNGSQMGANKAHNTSKQGGRDSRTNLNELRARKINTQQRRGDQGEGDFEKMFGKDVDQYLEGSEFDLDEYDKLSQFSRGTGRNSQANMKLKAMEQVYLQRIEAEAVTKKVSQRTGGLPSATTATAIASKKQKSPKKPPAFREFQDRFDDNPGNQHRGQILEFETEKQGGTEKRRPGPSPPRDGAAGASNFERQSRQRQ